MPRVWGGEDIPKAKTVFVWPSGAARADKVDMQNVTFNPGMSEKQVKELLVDEFDLDCDPNDILGLVDGYNQLCDKLSDIASNRKGYHIRFRDERSVEMSQLRRENDKLKEQLAAAGGSSSGGADAELRRLREENEKLRTENAKLKRELNSNDSSSSSSKRTSAASERSNTTESSKDKRRGSLEERSMKLMPSSKDTRSDRMKAAASNPLMVPDEPKPKKTQPKKSSGAPAEGGVAQGDRIQDIALAIPTGASQGTQNYEKLKEHWLEGCDDGELPDPEDLEDHVDDLLLSEKPKYVREAVPLSSLIDALADQWMRDNVL